MDYVRTYPYKAWVLMPSFKPAEVEFSEHYATWGGGDYDKAAHGKIYHVGDIFLTKESAIAAGWERIHAQEAALEKKQGVINKKRSALAKAAQE